MDSSGEIVDFFKEVQRAVSKHGLDRVIRHLSKIREDFGDVQTRDICDYIISTTSNHYLVDKIDVKNSKKRGSISDARRMCFALLKEHLLLSDEQIGDYFNGRSRQYINKELLSLPLNNAKLTTKYERNFVKDFIELTTNVLKYRNNYKLKKNKPQA